MGRRGECNFFLSLEWKWNFQGPTTPNRYYFWKNHKSASKNFDSGKPKGHKIAAAALPLGLKV